MIPPRVSPRDQERPFRSDELFFSTTDRKGIILNGNDVFVRVSGHALENLVGQPHNIIRHPDMPRAVFGLLWDYLDRDAPFAGYVKNMAADGCYYWVMALVAPAREGFLSVRFKPASPFFDVVRKLYPQLLATEHAAGQGNWRRGMQDATAQLVSALHGLGFKSYDHFMQAALAAELAARKTEVPSLTLDVLQGGDTTAATLDALSHSAHVIDGHLNTLFASVDDFLSVIKTLDEKASFLLGLSANVHLVSLNALISSCRLERGGEGLAVVSQNLATQSHDSMATIDQMTRQLLALTSALRDTAFSLSAAKLEVEMTSFFLHELRALVAADATDACDAQGRIATLAESISRSTARLAEALPRAQGALPALLRLQQELASDLRRLSCVHVLGKIHAAGIDDGGVFIELLERIFTQLSTASEELQELLVGVARIKDRLPRFATAARVAQPPIDRFCSLAATA